MPIWKPAVAGAGNTECHAIEQNRVLKVTTKGGSLRYIEVTEGNVRAILCDRITLLLTVTMVFLRFL